MRIIQLITLGHEVYGAQKHVLDLCTVFQKDGHEVLAVVGTGGDLTDLFEEHNIKYKIVPSLKREISVLSDFKCVGDLRKVYDEFKPDIVASHSSKAGILGRVACYLSGIPNTFTAHGWSFEDGIPYLRRNVFLNIERLVGRISDRIITVANLGREHGLKNKVARPEKLTTIYYGVADTGSKFTKEQQDIFTMTMVAGFREQKDHATLIEALIPLKDREWQLLLLGHGPLLDDVIAQTKAAGLDHKIKFEGMVPNVPDYLNKTDLMVLTTNWEGLPISILEGLSFGLPVVASDVSGVSEEVINEYNGLLVDRGNVEQVTAAISKLLDNPAQLKEYSKNSRLLFEKEFTQEAMYKKTKALYQEVIALKK